MSLQGKQVLVTGATGFLGGRLVERLALEWGAHVRALVRNLSRAPRIGRFPVEMVAGDIADQEAVNHAARGCEFLFHCAHEWRDEAADHKARAVNAAEVVARAALDAKASRLVHVSSFAVYGPGLADVLDETAPRQPTRNAYTLAKRSAEDVMRDYHRRHRLPVAVVQPTIVYGPFAGTWTAQPVLQLRNKRVVLLHGGSGICNAVYVDDVTEAMRLAAVRPEAVGEVFLVSGPEPVTWRAFYAAYERMLGIESTVSMSVAEARECLRQQRKARSTVAQLRRAIHSPKVPIAA